MSEDFFVDLRNHKKSKSRVGRQFSSFCNRCLKVGPIKFFSEKGGTYCSEKCYEARK